MSWRVAAARRRQGAECGWTGVSVPALGVECGCARARLVAPARQSDSVASREAHPSTTAAASSADGARRSGGRRGGAGGRASGRLHGAPGSGVTGNAGGPRRQRRRGGAVYFLFFFRGARPAVWTPGTRWVPRLSARTARRGRSFLSAVLCLRPTPWGHDAGRGGWLRAVLGAACGRLPSASGACCSVSRLGSCCCRPPSLPLLPPPPASPTERLRPRDQRCLGHHHHRLRPAPPTIPAGCPPWRVPLPLAGRPPLWALSPCRWCPPPGRGGHSPTPAPGGGGHHGHRPPRRRAAGAGVAARRR